MTNEQVKAARAKTLGPATPETLKYLLSPQAITVQLQAETHKINDHIESVHLLTISNPGDDKGTYPGILIELQAVFPGYIGIFHPKVLAFIKNAAGVSIVEENFFFHPVSSKIIASRYWGASRISLNNTQFNANPKPQTETFKVGNTKGKDLVWEYNAGEALGDGVSVYVIDTGGFANTDFTLDKLRIEFSDLNTLDPDGAQNHSTVVTNIAAGQTLGLAPKAKVWLQASPEMLPYTFIIAGMERVIKKNDERKTPGLLNLSFGKDFHGSGVYATRLLRAATKALTDKGIIVVCAAGNVRDFIDGSNFFPQMIPEVIMVGASDKDNKLARVFSNYGPRIDVYAPGTETPVLATSMGLGSDVQAGTSFAAPTVTGFLACLFSEELKANKDWVPWTSAKIQKMLREEYSETTDAYDYHGKRYPVRTLIAKSLANQSLPMPEPHIDFMDIKKSVLIQNSYTILLPPTEIEIQWPADKFVAFLDAMSKKNKPEYDKLFKDITHLQQDTGPTFKATRTIVVRYPALMKGGNPTYRLYPGKLDNGITDTEARNVALWLEQRLKELK